MYEKGGGGEVGEKTSPNSRRGRGLLSLLS